MSEELERKKKIAECIQPALDSVFPERELQAENAQLKAQLAMVVEALTPSDKTKAAYSGAFSFWIADFEEDGAVQQRSVTVPWTTIKGIMGAISKQSLNTPQLLEKHKAEREIVDAAVALLAELNKGQITIANQVTVIDVVDTFEAAVERYQKVEG